MTSPWAWEPTGYYAEESDAGKFMRHHGYDAYGEFRRVNFGIDSIRR